MNLTVLGQFHLVFGQGLIDKRNRVLLTNAGGKSTRNNRRRFFAATRGVQTTIQNCALINYPTVTIVITSNAGLNIFVAAVGRLFWSVSRILSIKLISATLPAPKYRQVVKENRFLVLGILCTVVWLLVLVNFLVVFSHDLSPE
jgi:hypothetical protein